MMSGPAPDWIAEVTRAWISLALIVSRRSVMPSAFLHSSVIGPLSTTSEAGTKSDQRTQCSVCSCAKAGVRPLARMPARPPVEAAAAPAPDSANARRRVMRVMCNPPDCVARGPTVSVGSEPGIALLGAVDLGQLVMRPFDGILGCHALDRLRVHVDDDVLGDDLGRLLVRGPGIAGEASLLRHIFERRQHWVGVPHRIALPHLGGAVGETLLRGEPFLEHRLRVNPGEEFLGGVLVL